MPDLLGALDYGIQKVYATLIEGGKLTTREIENIKSETATAIRSAGGSDADVRRANREIDAVVNLNGGPAKNAADGVTDGVRKLLVAGTVIGAIYLFVKFGGIEFVKDVVQRSRK
jgi:hypothetical protein